MRPRNAHEIGKILLGHVVKTRDPVQGNEVLTAAGDAVDRADRGEDAERLLVVAGHDGVCQSVSPLTIHRPFRKTLARCRGLWYSVCSHFQSPFFENWSGRHGCCYHPCRPSIVAYLKLETVARGLGFTDTSKSVEYVRWNTVRQYLGEIGFSQTIAKDGYIPENVFYRLAMKAKNAVAEAFQAKIADEVIPSIRKHGLYATYDTITRLMSQPETIIQIFTKIKGEQEKNRALEKRVCALEESNDNLRCENQMLAKEEQTWDSRQIVSRLVRLYSHYVCGDDFQQGWRNFYRELNYRHHINLYARPGDVAIIDRVQPEEWGTLVSVAASLCVTNNIDLVWAVNQTNAAAITSGGAQ